MNNCKAGRPPCLLLGRDHDAALLSPEWSYRLIEAAVRSVIWGFVGALYGMLFVAATELSRIHLPQIDPMIPAGVVATGLGALIYGSMRLAVIVAALCSMSSVFFLIDSGGTIEPLRMTLAIGLLGAVIGAFYGCLARRSRVYRADAKLLAGLFAGCVGSLILYFIMELAQFPLSPAWQVAILCPATGLVYTQVIEGFLRLFENSLPTAGDGALVGLAVASFIGFGLWLVAGYVTPEMAGQHTRLASAILQGLPTSVIAGLTGGALGGFLGGLAGKEWQDL